MHGWYPEVYAAHATPLRTSQESPQTCCESEEWSFCNRLLREGMRPREAQLLTRRQFIHTSMDHYSKLNIAMLSRVQECHGRQLPA